MSREDKEGRFDGGDGDGLGADIGDQAAAVGEAVTDLAPTRRLLLATLGAGTAGAALGKFGVPNLASVAAGGVEVPPPSGAASPPDHHDPSDIEALVSEDQVTHRATRDGSWHDPATWGGSVPDDFARAQIPADVTVTLAGDSTARMKTLRVDGALAFHPEKDSHLRAETVVTMPESVLQIGRKSRPIARESEARLTFVDLGPIDEDWDPNRLSTGLLALGEVRVHGTEKTTWSELGSAPTPGDSSLELPEAPTNWDEGDRLVVAGMDPMANEDEEVFVTGVSGSTVELDRTLKYDHSPPKSDLSAYVQNLDRNVQFVSENEAIPRRGHTMFMSRNVAVHYAGLYGLGRTDKSYAFTNPIHGKPPEDVDPNPRARYALHFHKTGIDTEEPHTVKGVAVRGSPGWGVVNHHSYAEVTDSVTYDVFGAGFVAEAGNERGSFVGNFALRSEGSGDLPDSRDFDMGDDDPGDVDDFGHGGHGFWFQGPSLTIEDNVAAGHRHHGFVFWNRPLIDRELRPGEEIHDRRGTVANFPLKFVDDEQMPHLVESDHTYDGKVSSAYVPIQSFRNNTTFASGGGLDISRHQFGWDHERFEDYSVIEGFTAFNVGPLVRSWGRVASPDHGNAEGGNNGLSIRYSHNLRVKDARLVWGRGREATKRAVDDEQAEKHPESLNSVGINRNTPYPFHVVFEGLDVEGWKIGARPLPRGITVYRDSRFANDVNVSVEDGHPHPARRIKLENCTFERGGKGNLRVGLDEPDDRGADEVFDDDGGVVMDGRPVYYEAQRPDHVPIPDQKTVDQLGADDLKELAGTDAGNLVGKTNRQLYDQYGIAVKGRPMPDDAVADERVSGGYLASPPPSPPREVWFEAEETTVRAPFETKSDPNASGDSYVVAGGVDSSHEPPSEGHLTYDFEVQGGEYEVYARAHRPSDEDDSFWVRMDDGDWIRWGGVGGERDFAWERVPEPETDDWSDHRQFSLSEGSHTFTVAFREDGAQLDKLFVSGRGRTPIGYGE
ncbi:G8 domain-containing protein [Haloarchaeobius sp. HME9146]|uniref:G8 domain-containing protein n=1 Tax=Haloarchaeobius sp. HME9146 TaxID=2978732 RepID=UPI0021BF044E|nr:G8 domain-containing protein [Haloarchaeobius sp. HME9146]MCT9097300.1 G8 domain-containing protein [Haloarchaeobius sp. HME9146]